MKKELLAVLLLVSILIACLINIRCVTGLTEELAAMVDDAEAQASSGNWEDARHTIESAFDLLERRNLYIGVALSLEDIDMITDSLDLIMGHIMAHSPGRVTAAVHLAKTRLDSIAAREQVSWGSVF